MQIFTPPTPGLGGQFGPRTDLQPPTGVPLVPEGARGSDRQSRLHQRGDREPYDLSGQAEPRAAMS